MSRGIIGISRRSLLSGGLVTVSGEVIAGAGSGPSVFVDNGRQVATVTIIMDGVIPFTRNISRSVDTLLNGLKRKDPNIEAEANRFLWPLLEYMRRQLNLADIEPILSLTSSGDAAAQTGMRGPYLAQKSDQGSIPPLLLRLIPQLVEDFTWSVNVRGAARLSSSAPRMVGIRSRVEFSLIALPQRELPTISDSEALRHVARATMQDIMHIYDAYLARDYPGLKIAPLPPNLDDRFLPDGLPESRTP